MIQVSELFSYGYGYNNIHIASGCVCAFFFQGLVQDENSAKRPRLIEFHELLFFLLLLRHCMLG